MQTALGANNSELIPSTDGSQNTFEVEVIPTVADLSPKDQEMVANNGRMARISIAGLRDSADVGKALEDMGAIRVGAGKVMIANSKVEPLLDMAVKIAMNDSIEPDSRIAAGELAVRIQDAQIRGLLALHKIISANQMKKGEGDPRKQGPKPGSQFNIVTENVQISK